MSNADILVCFVYVVYITAPSIRQELWLRTALFIASVGFATWGVLLGSWPVIAANILFCVMSLRQIQRAYADQQTVRLGDDASLFGAELFPAMLDRDLQRFWDAGTELRLDGETLTTVGEKSDFLYLVLEGGIAIVLADGATVERTAPTLIGEISTLSGSDSGMATATVVVHDALVQRWLKSDVEDLQSAYPSMTGPFLKGLSAQMASRVIV